MELGADLERNELTIPNISYIVGENTVVPTERIISAATKTEQRDSSREIVTYRYAYTLTLKGIIGDGYLRLSIPSDILEDKSTNINDAIIVEIKNDGKNLYVDNTKPRIGLSEAMTENFASSSTEIEIPIKITDMGAGILREQFTKEDIDVTVDGRNINLQNVTVTDQTGNPYDLALGGEYFFTIRISGITQDGTIRIKIDTNKVIDRANNGLIETTLPINITIDNTGPRVGKITTNADEFGNVVNESIILGITDCSDEDAIASYEWQVRTQENGWTTIETINTTLSESSTMHQPTKEERYYYRVIVTDRLGNSTISDEAEVYYMETVSMKPMIRLTQEFVNVGEVRIIGIVKSSKEIANINVNRNEMDPNQFTVTKQAEQTSTTFTYAAMANGTYEFTATDIDGNSATEKINVSIISENSAAVTYEKYNATSLEKAHIIFTLNEEGKINNPTTYAPIVFSTTEYATKIRAELPETMDYVTDRTFDFVNRGGRVTQVTVPAPIFTKVYYLRSIKENITHPMNVTRMEGELLIKSMEDSIILINSNPTNYYEINGSSEYKMLNTEEESAIDNLGSATFVYMSNAQGTKGRQIQSSPLDSLLEQRPRYANGNITGIYATLPTAMYEDIDSLDSESRYETFKIVITP